MSLPTTLEVPNIAIAGADALAADVNEDFDYITTAQNATNVQVNTNTDEITTARNGAASLDARLDAADADRALKAYSDSPTFTGIVTIPTGASIADYAKINSPTFTGVVTIPTGASIADYAKINSPTFTGVPVAPTAAVDTDTTQLATTAFAKKEADDAQAFAIQRANHTGTQPQSTVDNLVSDLAGKISADNAALTGIPTAPTAANGTKTTQIATTEFVGNAAFNSTLPEQTGNAGKFVTTDGTDASWVPIPKVEVVSYDNRATLRALTPENNSQIIIDELGMFVFYLAGTDIDDDETCFTTPTGCWLLELVHPDLMTAIGVENNSVPLTGTVANTITTVTSTLSAQLTVPVAGAQVGQPVTVSPPSSIDGRVCVYGYVSAASIVTIVAVNPSSEISATLPTGNWSVAVHQS